MCDTLTSLDFVSLALVFLAQVIGTCHLCWMKLAVKSCLMIGGSGCLNSEENSISEGEKELQTGFLAAAVATTERALLRIVKKCMVGSRVNDGVMRWCLQVEVAGCDVMV